MSHGSSHSFPGSLIASSRRAWRWRPDCTSEGCSTQETDRIEDNWHADQRHERHRRIPIQSKREHIDEEKALEPGIKIIDSRLAIKPGCAHTQIREAMRGYRFLYAIDDEQRTISIIQTQGFYRSIFF